MNGTLDDQYLEWLYRQIAAVSNRNPKRSYWELAKQLYSKEFSWFVPNDDNRIEDGKDLRWEFLMECGLPEDHPWMELDCSMLEMLVALARRTSFESYGTVMEWFWELMDNIGFRECTDDKYDSQIRRYVDQRLDTIINRKYEPNGDGGLFPLKHSFDDQRKVEIWYQMSHYLLENEPAE